MKILKIILLFFHFLLLFSTSYSELFIKKKNKNKFLYCKQEFPMHGQMVPSMFPYRGQVWSLYRKYRFAGCVLDWRLLWHVQNSVYLGGIVIFLVLFRILNISLVNGTRELKIYSFVGESSQDS